MKNEKRQVWIDERANDYFVRYVSRRKHQHHSPAQFDKRSVTRQQVIDWISANGYELVVGGVDMGK